MKACTTLCLYLLVVAFCIPAFSYAQSYEDNEALARRFVEEVWNQGKMDVCNEVLAANYTMHTNGQTAEAQGPEAAAANIRNVRADYPDLNIAIDDVFATSHMVTARWNFVGTHKDLGKKVDVKGTVIYHIEDGKLAISWNAFDNAAFVTQLGGTVTPPEGLEQN